MSFILDALRKSDAERQRTVTPGLSDVRYAARRAKRNIWLPVLVVVLAANAVFLAVQFLGRDPEPEPSSPAPAPAAQVTNPPAPVAPEPAPEPAAADIRPLAREAEFGEPLLEPDVVSEFDSPPAPVIVEAAEGPPAIAATSRIVPSNDLPTAEQLMGSGGLNIPMLNLDLHVYSETPAGRFVVINSQKYKEGGRLPEGPIVETINKDGVILTNQGRRFTLSRK